MRASLTPDQLAAIDDLSRWYNDQPPTQHGPLEFARELAEIVTHQLTQQDRERIRSYYLDRLATQLAYDIQDSDWEGFIIGGMHQPGDYETEIIPAARFVCDGQGDEPQYVERLLEIFQKSHLQCTRRQLLAIVECEARHHTDSFNAEWRATPEELYAVFRDDYFLRQMLQSA